MTWIQVLLLLLAHGVQAASPPVSRAQTHTVSDERWAECPVEARPLYELDTSYVDAQAHPLPEEGTFPPPSIKPEDLGATYEYISGSRLSGDRQSATIIIEGVSVVQGGIFVGHAIEELTGVTFAQLTSIFEFLTLWSTCSVEPIPQQSAGLVTDFGLKWVFSKGDPFLVSTTPLSVVRSGNISHAKGALPLLVVDARSLSDGRAMVVIGEGSAVSSDGSWLLPEIPGSIWILDDTEFGWRLDGIFGGVSLRPTGWIAV